MPRAGCLIVVWLALVLPVPAGASGYRYVSNQNLIVIEQGATATLSSLKAALPRAPLTLVDRERHIWLLSANLLVTGGGTLRLVGKGAGGDVNELRLKSENSDAPGSFISVTADHGTIDIRSTRVISWDSAANGPDLEYEGYGRAFIRARSRMRSMVLIPLQSRMDITDSEVAYLGYNANESYGLVWKVVAPDPFVFEYVRIYGNVVNSRIHDNYFGLYSAGSRGAEWRHNRVYDNVQYGLAPHNRSDDLRIDDNDVYDNGHHGISVRQNCSRVLVRNNRVWGNGGSGVTLHGGSNRGQVLGNRIFRNFDAGITVYGSSGNTLRENIVRDNGHIGIQIAMGASDNRVEHNEIGDNGFYGLFVGKGRGRPPTGGDGHPRHNQIAHNRIYGSGAENLRAGELSLNSYLDNAVADARGGNVGGARGSAGP
jgi:mannuronan 5-epimerase